MPLGCVQGYYSNTIKMRSFSDTSDINLLNLNFKHNCQVNFQVERQFFNNFFFETIFIIIISQYH